MIECLPGENLTFTMLYNEERQFFVTSFRGIVGTVEKLVTALEAGGIGYTLHNIPGATVMDYIYQHYTKVLRPIVVPLFTQAMSKFPNYTFVFTGHSLGAAFATMTAHDFVLSGYVHVSQVVLYNFGSPRLGNFAYAQNVVKTLPIIWRVVHYKDLVPHLPPCVNNSSGLCSTGSSVEVGVRFLSENVSENEGLWEPYHVWENVFYNNENSTSYVICNGGEDPKCSDQYSLVQCNLNDHGQYVGVIIGC